MYPELHIQIWMSNKRNASMIIGMSIQVSLKLLYWKKNLPDGYMWSGERLTRKQQTSRARSFMARTAILKEKQKWSHEKPQLDNARKLRGIYFIDPEDKEFKETIKNARKKLETSMAPAMPCKISKNNKNYGSGASW